MLKERRKGHILGGIKSVLISFLKLIEVVFILIKI